MPRRKTVAALVLLIANEGKPPTAYHVRRLRDTPAVSGVAWRLSKGSGRHYDVTVSKDDITCECLGFLRWGHCRHCDWIKELLT